MAPGLPELAPILIRWKGRRAPSWLGKWVPASFSCWAYRLPRTDRARAVLALSLQGECVGRRNGFLEEVAPELILQEKLMAGAVQGKGRAKVWWEHCGWCHQRLGGPSGWLEGVWEMKLVGEDWHPWPSG